MGRGGGERYGSSTYEKVQTEVEEMNRAKKKEEKKTRKEIAAVATAAMCCISKCVNYGAGRDRGSSPHSAPCQMIRQNGRKTLSNKNLHSLCPFLLPVPSALLRLQLPTTREYNKLCELTCH